VPRPMFSAMDAPPNCRKSNRETWEFLGKRRQVDSHERSMWSRSAGFQPIRTLETRRLRSQDQRRGAQALCNQMLSSKQARGSSPQSLRPLPESSNRFRSTLAASRLTLSRLQHGVYQAFLESRRGDSNP
jgi:hypothetical protein